eukprot:CAMPEP_0116886756 /NCGR_PEP_ID=MMETSP0463-20121206/20708_1 /TAXON_ID=181622 /ORGANISM="Strombidinopsis sp, Strain SopsisLIS2011" /LENGTH=51 /DNA_ID=CAMNT_0004547699 /DNA_START=216 /DNA_END=371 /DNA_ORIENTATION=-
MINLNIYTLVIDANTNGVFLQNSTGYDVINMNTSMIPNNTPSTAPLFRSSK